jgi:acyl-homoserine lactone acylase PvdQ
VPHIYARNEADLFFAQGFYAARLRLFQIDLWRRRGLGQLAEIFGPAYVEQDKATRLFLYRGDMKKEWAVYSPDSQKMFGQFVSGINAYVEWINDHPKQMPFEFKLLHYKPAHWSAEDAVRIRSHGYLYNFEHPGGRFASNAEQKRDELLVNTLHDAYEDMERLQGPDPKKWAWSELHHNLLQHPFSALVV